VEVDTDTEAEVDTDTDTETEAGTRAVDKARRVAEFRNQAESCLARARSPEGLDLEALRCYYESQKKTTEIFRSAADCPRCYASAGEGAVLMGSYYSELAAAQKRHREETTSADERSRLNVSIPENDALARQYFREALRFFDDYRQNGDSVDVRVYRRAFRVAMSLEEYQRALHYLDLWESNTRLTEDEKQAAKKWRATAEEQLEKKILREGSDER